MGKKEKGKSRTKKRLSQRSTCRSRDESENPRAKILIAEASYPVGYERSDSSGAVSINCIIWGLVQMSCTWAYCANWPS